MFDDPWPEEPPDPYADLGDPESGLALHIPDDVTVSRELFRAFWGLVAVFNVGLFATAIGVMLIGFEGAYALGGAVLAVGLVSLAYGARRYRRYRSGALDGEDAPPEG